MLNSLVSVVKNGTVVRFIQPLSFIFASFS